MTDLERIDQDEQKLNDELIAALLLLLRDKQEELSDETIKFYAKYGHDGIVTYKDSRKRVSLTNRQLRIAMLFGLIGDILDSAMLAMTASLKTHLTELIQHELDFWKSDLKIDDILYQTWGNDDRNWYDRLWNTRDKWDDVLCDDFLLDFAKGVSFTDTYKVLNKRFISMEKALKRLVESESAAVRTITRLMVFKDFGIKRYQYFTQADERTCHECAPLHGEIFPMTAFKIGVTAPPIHPNCRDWIEPIE